MWDSPPVGTASAVLNLFVGDWSLHWTSQNCPGCRASDQNQLQTDQNWSDWTAWSCRASQRVFWRDTAGKTYADPSLYRQTRYYQPKVRSSKNQRPGSRQGRIENCVIVILHRKIKFDILILAWQTLKTIQFLIIIQLSGVFYFD